MSYAQKKKAIKQVDPLIVLTSVFEKYWENLLVHFNFKGNVFNTEEGDSTNESNPG